MDIKSLNCMKVNKKWFSIPSFALECNLAQKTTCDECFKCGGIWCNNPHESRRCVALTGGGDEWCPEHMESVPYMDPNSRDGVVFKPQFEDVLAEINSGKVTTLYVTGYSATKGEKTAKYKILNTTQTSDKSKVHVDISEYQSTIQVTTTISAGFCSSSSQKFEYAFVEVDVAGVVEKAVLKYVVPCGCGCSGERVVADQTYCHGHGDLVCGTCRCDVDDGWRGKFCECGPVSSSCVDSSHTSTTRCSGNGHCDECNQCQCFPDKEGSQYFDQQDNCKDLSATVKEFLDCHNQPCGKCDLDVFFHKWDSSVLNQLYDASRKLWVDLGPLLPGYWGCIKNSTIHFTRKC